MCKNRPSIDQICDAVACCVKAAEQENKTFDLDLALDAWIKSQQPCSTVFDIYFRKEVRDRTCTEVALSQARPDDTSKKDWPAWEKMFVRRPISGFRDRALFFDPESPAPLLEDEDELSGLEEKLGD